MPSLRIPKNLNCSMYFITLTIKNWYYLFDRHWRWEILLNSLKHCQKHKWLKIYSWVFMLNHIHLIVQSQDMIWFIRDFKKYTTKEIINNNRNKEVNLIKLFTNKEWNIEFWAKTNSPKLIETEKYFFQKKNYIEENPVRKFYVNDCRFWVYSSANDEDLLLLSCIDELG